MVRARTPGSINQAAATSSRSADAYAYPSAGRSRIFGLNHLPLGEARGISRLMGPEIDWAGLWGKVIDLPGGLGRFFVSLPHSLPVWLSRKMGSTAHKALGSCTNKYIAGTLIRSYTTGQGFAMRLAYLSGAGLTKKRPKR